MRRIMADLIRVAAVGDLHCTRTSEGALQPLFAEMAESADIIALAGDLVDYGLAEEAHMLARELSVALKANVPVVAVHGDPEFDEVPRETVARILCDAAVTIFYGDAGRVQ